MEKDTFTDRNPTELVINLQNPLHLSRINIEHVNHRDKDRLTKQLGEFEIHINISWHNHNQII